MTLNDKTSPEVFNFLEGLYIKYKAIDCDPELAYTQVFCRHYGYSEDESANVVLIASKRGEPMYAACVVLATTRLDVKKKREKT